MLDPVFSNYRFKTLKQAKQINYSNHILQCFVLCAYIVYSYNSLSNDY